MLGLDRHQPRRLAVRIRHSTGCARHRTFTRDRRDGAVAHAVNSVTLHATGPPVSAS
jgi:hypothetical protein